MVGGCVTVRHHVKMTPEEMFDRFVDGLLPKDSWTHEAHLITCWVALRDRTPAETLAFLRHSIMTHNCGIGIRNTETGGYHESLTVYYVTAVHHADAATLDDLYATPSCGRQAPLNHWTRERLFGTEARLAWVTPDVRELPWTPQFDTEVSL